MGAAFEVNRQMCDLEIDRERWDKIGKEWDSKKKKIVYSIFNENDMEKKKMTKAEAFEWLDGKKIRTEGNHEKVLRKLFDLGFVWKNLRDTRVDLGWQLGEVYGLTISDDEVAWWTTPHLFETHGADEVTADDILSIEIVEENRSEDEVVEIVELGKKIQCLLPKLSGHRHVVITEDDIILREEGMCLFHSDPF